MSEIAEFRRRVDKAIGSQFMGSEIGRLYGMTKHGQRFAIVTSTVLWYAVRVVVDMDEYTAAVVGRRAFWTAADADGFVFDTQHNLERMTGIVTPDSPIPPLVL
uniref:DUF2693 domain-containing protein n=1 Tax=Panagrellus redivivus TaxID=6233 RepID=A0A7E4VGD4_PANRE